MPTEQEQKAAADAAAVEKADNDTAESVLKEIDDLAEKGTAVEKDEFVKVKKSQLHKIASDRNNYKKATLSKKAEDRDLNNKGGGDNKDNKDNKDNQAVIDLKKVDETATTAAQKLLRNAAEKSAKQRFFKDHPEYLDDKAWQEMLPNLTFKGDEVTTEEVLDRMESAVLEHKRKTGKLEEYMKVEAERARAEGRAAGRMDQARGGGGPGDKNEEGKTGTLGDKGQEIARSMKLDPEQVKNIDIAKDNVIDVITPKKKK